MKHIQSLEAQLNTQLAQPVPAVAPDTPAAPPAARDNVAEQYLLYRQQGTPNRP